MDGDDATKIVVLFKKDKKSHKTRKLQKCVHCRPQF
jgi:hypothetical protein